LKLARLVGYNSQLEAQRRIGVQSVLIQVVATSSRLKIHVVEMVEKHWQLSTFFCAIGANWQQHLIS